MLTVNIFISALLVITGKADYFLLPCPIKYLTHIDCPGCGFQRSVMALVQGNFLQSFKLYPPTGLFLASCIATALVYYFKWNKETKLLKALYFLTGSAMLINYVYKIFTHQI